MKCIKSVFKAISLKDKSFRRKMDAQLFHSAISEVSLDPFANDKIRDRLYNGLLYKWSEMRVAIEASRERVRAAKTEFNTAEDAFNTAEDAFDTAAADADTLDQIDTVKAVTDACNIQIGLFDAYMTDALTRAADALTHAAKAVTDAANAVTDACRIQVRLMDAYRADIAANTNAFVSFVDGIQMMKERCQMARALPGSCGRS